MWRFHGELRLTLFPGANASDQATAGGLLLTRQIAFQPLPASVLFAFVCAVVEVTLV